jgi:uncharacterized membrane protein
MNPIIWWTCFVVAICFFAGVSYFVTQVEDPASRTVHHIVWALIAFVVAIILASLYPVSNAPVSKPVTMEA